MFRDKNGLIVQLNGDGGDTLQREGFFWLAMTIKSIHEPDMTDLAHIVAEYGRNIQLLHPTPTTWVRHPEQWNDPNDCSRDQLTPNIILFGFLGMKTLLNDAFRSIVLRGRFPNGDLISPEHFGWFVRSWYAINPFEPLKMVLFPLAFLCLLLGDLFMLLNSIIRIVKNKLNNDDVGDDLNHCASLIQAKFSCPTPISWLARKLFFWFQPINRNLAHYFRTETGGNYEIAVVWSQVVLKHF